MKQFKRFLLPIAVGTMSLGAIIFTGCGQSSDSNDASASPGASEAELSGSPEVAVQAIAHALGEGEGGVLWQAMPASYQSDVTEVVRLAGTKLDAEIYDKIFAMLDRTVNVADQQKEFMFNTSLGSAPSAEEIEKFRAAWPSVVHLVTTLTQSSLASTEGLQSFDGQAFFSDTVSAVLKDMDALSQLNPGEDQATLSEYKNAEVVYIEGTDTEATLQMDLPDGSSETETFVKIEDRWVPKEMADDWETSMANARLKLEAINPEQIAQQKPQIMSVFAMMDGVLTQIENAETQEQFDQALQGAMMPIMGLMMMGQGMGGGAMPAAPQMPPAPENP